MPDFFSSLDPHWAWLSLGVLLVALEILVPGFFLIWLGLAAVATGVIAWVIAPSISVQLGIFAVLSFVMLFAAQSWLKKNPIVSEEPHLNQRAHRLIGDVIILTQAIDNGRGRAKVGDGEWAVRGPDASAGERVKIVAVDGATLIVEPA
jgi:membrane protein implicated in regulation of membrane protease activity